MKKIKVNTQTCDFRYVFFSAIDNFPHLEKSWLLYWFLTRKYPNFCLTALYSCIFQKYKLHFKVNFKILVLFIFEVIPIFRDATRLLN